jgi:tripartite-type tricarboxylate transporter receptor subunit TctC
VIVDNRIGVAMRELIEYARARPDQLSYSSGLVGVSPQLSMKLVKLMTKIDIVNVPYKNGAQKLSESWGQAVVIENRARGGRHDRHGHRCEGHA